jgi:rare lipoprotein A
MCCLDHTTLKILPHIAFVGFLFFAFLICLVNLHAQGCFRGWGIMNQAAMRAAILLALLWVAFYRPAFAECGLAGVYTSERQPAHSTPFGNRDVSATHRSLPPGTRVVVRSQPKGRSIIVRIIDQGLFGLGQIINLSAGAIQALGMETPAPVCVEVITYGSKVRGYRWVSSGRQNYAQERSIPRLAQGGHRLNPSAGVRHGAGRSYVKLHRRRNRYAKAYHSKRLAHGGARRNRSAHSRQAGRRRYAKMHRRGHPVRRSGRRRHA